VNALLLLGDTCTIFMVVRLIMADGRHTYPLILLSSYIRRRSGPSCCRLQADLYCVMGSNTLRSS
jgi:hypothetical protein